MNDVDRLNDITTNCECGWDGANCDVALVDVPLNKVCNVEHAYCLLVKEHGQTTAQCACICPTWGGVECSEYMVDTGSAVGSMILSFFVALFLITWMCVRDMRTYRSFAFTKDHFKLSEWERVNGIASYHPSDKFPRWLKLVFCYRFVAFVFALGVMISEFTIRGIRLLQFFTVWNFCLLIIYFGLGSFITFKGILEEKKEDKHFNESNEAGEKNNIYGDYSRLMLSATDAYVPVEDRKMNLLQKIHYAVLQIELPCTLLIGLVVWGVLYSETPEDVTDFYSYVEHATNFFLMLFDFIFCTRYAFVSWHIMLILIWLSIYGLFQMIFVTSGGCPAYFFLDLSTRFTAFWLLGIFLVGIVVYLVIAGFSWHCECILGKRYYTCDAEDELDIPYTKEIDAIFCISCQKRCCSRCGPTRYRVENSITPLNSNGNLIS